MFFDPDSKDARLTLGSPCIDTGDASAAPDIDYFWTARPKDGNSDGVAKPDMGYHEFVPAPTLRLSDRTRFSTAIEIARRTFPRWEGVTNVVIASGDDRAAADPLAASGLCWAYDAPLFLVSGARTPDEVKTAIKQVVDANGPVTLRVVGGPISVPDARLNEIRTYVGAANIAGIDRIVSTGGRYDLAGAIALRMRSVAALDPAKTMPKVALFANGADPATFFDALALSPIASGTGAPILLVTADTVPSATSAVLGTLRPTTKIVGGGPNTISEKVRVQLGATRWSGRTRYDTAIAIANGAVARGWLSRSSVGVAAKLPDALTGGSLVGREGGVLVLTDGATLTPATKTWLMTYKKQIERVYVFGGPLSISESVRTAIASAIK
jgi:putative cell wall-binding protein